MSLPDIISNRRRIIEPRKKVSAMSAKAMGNTNNRFNLKKTILDIVRAKQPISAEEIRWKIEEKEGCTLSRPDVNQRLEKMLGNKTLAKIRLKNDREKYVLAKKQKFVSC
jgi:NAD(P)H-nitrite reductase large subunit